jgi:hypothetical protein
VSGNAADITASRMPVVELGLLDSRIFGKFSGLMKFWR